MGHVQGGLVRMGHVWGGLVKVDHVKSLSFKHEFDLTYFLNYIIV